MKQEQSHLPPKDEEHGYIFNQCHFTYVQPSKGSSKMINMGQSWMEQMAKENLLEGSNSVLQSPRGRRAIDTNLDAFDHQELASSKKREVSFTVSQLYNV